MGVLCLQTLLHWSTVWLLKQRWSWCFSHVDMQETQGSLVVRAAATFCLNTSAAWIWATVAFGVRCWCPGATLYYIQIHANFSLLLRHCWSLRAWCRLVSFPSSPSPGDDDWPVCEGLRWTTGPGLTDRSWACCSSRPFLPTPVVTVVGSARLLLLTPLFFSVSFIS